MIWLSLDPETRRVAVQTHEFRDGDFPPGLRGAGWPRAVLEVEDDALDDMLSGSLDGDAVDAMHRAWWNASQASGKPRWPRLPDGR